MVSQSWKELSEEDRSKYQEMARIDRERYEKAKAAYKGPWRVPDVKHPNPPKKPMSAFLAFGNERRKAIADANPSLTNAEISTLLSKLWKQCPVDVKQAYRDREAREREIFKKYRAEWEREKDLSFVEATVDEDCECSSSTRSTAAHCDDETTDMGMKSPPPISQAAAQDVSRHYTDSFCPHFGNDRSFDAVRACAPNSAHPTEMSNSTPRAIHLPPCEKVGRPARLNFEDYSIDEILQDEELFEDFSPDDVPCVPPPSRVDYRDGSFTAL